MASFQIAFDLVAPLVIYMAVGRVVRLLDLLSGESLRQINAMIFKLLIPLQLFFDIYSADLGATADPALFIWAGSLTVAVFLVTLFVTKRTVKDRPDVPTMTQAIFRSNSVLFGSVISSALAGEAGAAVSAALSVLIVPLFNILAVIVFEVERGGKVDLRRVLINIAKNPLVDAGVLGAVVNLTGIKIPALIFTPLNTLGDLATPLALVVLGAMLSLGSIVSHKRLLFTAVFCRLVAVPAVCLGVLIALGFRNEMLVVLMAVFASPTAVASAPMAQSMGGNCILASEAVALSTVFSIITVFLFTFTLSSLGLF